MRRLAAAAVALGFLFTSLLAGAQSPAKVHRVGILSPGATPAPSVATSPNLVPIALRELGYVEGQNLVVERRFAEGRPERLPALARELVERRMDVIVAVSEAIPAAKEATTTIPIVMGFGFNPVERGFVASLARPGGNITGVLYAPEGQLVSKRLELLKEAVPQAARIAMLATRESDSQAQIQAARAAAARLRVSLLVVELQGTDYDQAFATMVAERAEGLFVSSSAILNRDRQQIIARAARHRFPAMYEWREQAEVGGLMSYGSSILGLSRRVAQYVDKILKGANPGDLPVEQPTNFELVVNAKTAKSLGLTIPPALLSRADVVLQ